MNSVFSNVPSFKASRLPSLFSDFSHLKDINPEGYNANISSWEALLNQCLREHTFQSSISLPKDRLSDVLSSPQYGSPKSLELVIDTLVNRRVFIPWSLYKDDTTVFSSLLAGISPKNLWVNLMGSLGLVSHANTGEFYIHRPSLVALASKVIEYLDRIIESECCYSARLFNFESFRNVSKQVDRNLSDIDIEALLIHLSREAGKIRLQKVTGPDDKSLDYVIKIGGNQNIIPADAKVVEIKSTITTIESRIEVLDRSMHTDIPQQINHLIDTKAPEFRIKALLKKKRQLAKSLEAALSVSSQLNELMSKINDAHANGIILDSLQAAKSVLSILNKENSKIDIGEFVAELDTLIASTDDTSEALGVSLGSDHDDIIEGLEDIASAESKLETHGNLSHPKQRTEVPAIHLQDNTDTVSTKEVVPSLSQDDGLDDLSKELSQLQMEESNNVVSTEDSKERESESKGTRTKNPIPA